MQASDGPPVEHVTVYGSASGSVRSTSPNVQTTLAGPVLGVQQSQTQATAFVQPTQQQQQSQAHPEPASQEPPPPVLMEAAPSAQAERPSTSSAVFGTVSATPGTSSMSKRPREEEQDSSAMVTETDPTQEDPSEPPIPKKLRIIQRVGPEEEVLNEDSTETEGVVPTNPQGGQDSSQDEVFAVLEQADDDGASQSVPGELEMGETPEQPQHDVIIIETDTEGEDDEEEEEEEEDDQDYDEEEDEEEEEDEDEDEEEDGGMGEEGEDSNEGSGDANDGYEGEDPEGADVTDPGTETEESLGASDSTQRPADSHTASFETSAMEALSTEPPITSSSSRMPQSPRRPPHRLNVHPASSQELGPTAQVQRIPVRRQSVGRVPQLAPAMASSAQQFFDDDDRMVPSAPTLAVSHRTDSFDQAIHSPQVAGVHHFRACPPDDLPQTSSSSHSDLGQLASQGGLGMYDSPLFLSTHEEESGGRSVPTTLLQVAAPAMFSEAPSDTLDHASQSVPMVSTSTPGLVAAAPGDDRDDVMLEPDADSRPSAEASLDSVVSQGEAEEPGQPSVEAGLPSTSQEPSSSSAGPLGTLSRADTSSSSQPRPSRPAASRQLQRWSENPGGRMKRGGHPFQSRGTGTRRFAR